MEDSNLEWRKRAKTNTRNLDDLIHYFEYAKDTGYTAARVDLEQEEYWAILLRRLLMKDVINYLVPLYDQSVNNMLIGIKFTCSNCGHEGELTSVYNELKVGNKDDYEISMHCDCSLTRIREEDIKKYLEDIMNEWNK